MSRYLGRHISSLLGDAPFKAWPVEVSVEDDDPDDPRIYYVFLHGALEAFCGLDERIKVIFVRADEFDGVELSAVPFNSTRRQVLERFGVASASGARDQTGQSGGWDRFERPDHAVHVEYRSDSDAVKQVTLMRSDAIP